MRIEVGLLRDRLVGEDGRTVVMVDDQVILLSSLASEVLRMVVTGPLELRQIADGLVQAFGEPGEETPLDQAVSSVVSELEERGVVRFVKRM